MQRLSRDYATFLEKVVFSLLAEREKNGKGDLDEFEELDLDRNPETKPETYVPLKVKEQIVATYKQFCENGWK